METIRLESVKPSGKPQADEAAGARGVGHDAEEELGGQRTSCRSPRLGDVGLRIRNRCTEVALDATELLGKPCVLESGRCIEHAPNDNVAAIAVRYPGKVNFVGIAGRGETPGDARFRVRHRHRRDHPSR